MNAENANRTQEFSSAAHFGYAVVLRRTMLGKSRKDLVADAGLSYPYISEIEKGSKEPSAKSLRGLAAALDFASVAEMMAWVEEQPPQRSTASTDSRTTDELPPADFLRPPAPSESSVSSGRQSLRPVRSRSTDDELSIAVDRAVRRLLAGVVDDLRRDIERIVEEEVARRLGEDGSNW